MSRVSFIVRTIRTLIIMMPVWIRPAEPWANVSWTAEVTVAVKLIVYQPSKMSTVNALARFMELVR